MFTSNDVEFLLVGGASAMARGAIKQAEDVDCLAGSSRENLGRVAAALRELNARLRVGRLTDAESRALKVPIDAEFLANSNATTWMTDAGPVDVMLTMPGRDGTRRPYEEYEDRSSTVEYLGVVVRVAALDDVIASKEYANRPKDQEALPELHDLLRLQDGE